MFSLPYQSLKRALPSRKCFIKEPAFYEVKDWVPVMRVLFPPNQTLVATTTSSFIIECSIETHLINGFHLAKQ